MNKTIQSTRGQSPGSDRKTRSARSNTLRTREKSFSGTSLTVIAAVLAAYAGDPAQAACNSTASTVTCSGNVSGAHEFLGQTGNQNVTANSGFTLDSGRWRVQTDGNITLNASNIAITNGNGTLGTAVSNGVIHMNTTGAGRSSVINLSDSAITVTTGNVSLGGSQGVSAQTNPTGNTTGLTQINATNVNVDMQTANSRAGLNANSGGTGTSEVNMHGGSVKTNGAIASGLIFFAGVRANSMLGNAQVLMDQGAWVESVNQASGIQATAAGAGNATVTIGADAGGAIEGSGPSRAILTKGDIAQGIFAESENGAITIHNEASALPVAIETQGVDANGIWANVVSGGTGSITIDNKGSIQTAGTDSNSILAQSHAGAIDITNTAALATTGGNAGDINASSTGGDITLTNSGVLSTQGVNANALAATTTGAGTVDIGNTASITTSGIGSNGINASTVTGAITIGNSGAITTAGAINASGISANATGANAGLIKITNSGAITTAGAVNASGISANATGANAGLIKITNSGDIATQGTAGSTRGIQATTAGGSTDISNSATISTQANSDAIYSTSSSPTGTVSIANSGILQTTGDNANGMTGLTVDGLVSLTNTGIVSTNGTGSNGINAVPTGGAPITIADGTGVIVTRGASSNGINAVTTTGAIDITSRAITTSGAGSNGVYASTTTGAINVTSLGVISTVGANADGVNAQASGGGNVTIANSGAVSTVGDGSKALSTFTPGNGAITITNTGALSTQGGSAQGIAVNLATGSATITNSGAISTLGNLSDGINTSSSGGAISIANTAALQTQGPTARGINAYATGGTVNIASSGPIVTSGSINADGVLANTINTVVTADVSNNITTAGATSPAVEVISNTTGNTLYYHDGTATVTGGSNAISLWQGGNAGAGSGTVHIGANALIDASAALGGVQSLMEADNTVLIDAGSRVMGGSGSGVDVTGQTSRLTNAGTIGAMSDLAVHNYSFGSTNQSFDLTNTASGLITGYMMLGDGANTFANAGTWNLRNFADTNADGVRDTQSVAIANFGTSGANAITNTGTIALLGAGTAPVNNVNATGAYLPLGNSFNTPTAGGPVQGQILGVKTFTNSGLIDLTANPVTGNVLVISGGHTAGTDGGGVFVSNGGTVKFNTFLNQGDANSRSDVLVVDSTQLGTAPTSLAVNHVGGAGALTTGNGIALVEVLNKSASANGTFALAAPLVGGPYEYTLFHNGVGANAADGNWYLRSTINCTQTPNLPQCQSMPPAPPGTTEIPSPNIPNYRVETSLDAVLPALTLRYGSALLDTLHERIGEAHDGRRLKDEETGPGWGRIIGWQGKDKGDKDTSIYGKNPAYRYGFFGVQAGADLYRREAQNGTRDQAGLYLSVGGAEATVTHFDNKTGRDEFNAYGVGGYWTRFTESGGYLDFLLQATWYDEVTSSANRGYKPLKTEGLGWAASLEGGKPFKFDHGYFAEPQAQLVYQHVDLSSADDNGSRVNFDDVDSLTGRLGVRLGRTWVGDKPSDLRTAWIRPSVWHEFMGKTKTQFSTETEPATFRSQFNGTWFELNAGLSGRTSRTTEMFVNLTYDTRFDASYAYAIKAGVRKQW